MTGKQKDVISGTAMLTTGRVEAVLDLKKHLLTVKLDTDRDGVFDAQVSGEPSSRSQTDSLSALLYADALKYAADGSFNEKDVRSLGIMARGIDTVNRGGRS